MITGAIRIPTLVRVKPGALGRLGLYLRRPGFLQAVLMVSDGLRPEILAAAKAGLAQEGIRILAESPIRAGSVEEATEIFRTLPRSAQAVIGLGGGKALDGAKFAASLAGLPYFAVPTSLSNDGFCSPQSSLTLGGQKKAAAVALPYGVVVDTAVCLEAPVELWCSGVGDLAAKFTAVEDWKIAFRACGTPVNDFAALLSDATVYQFLARPVRDIEGVKVLGTALLLNGIAMEICGSSRPASGSEHLISHALDQCASRPRLHGIQVGIAAYMMSALQGRYREELSALFARTGFWEVAAKDPIPRAEWLEAVRRAPTLKDNFWTVLSTRDCLPEIVALMESDPVLRGVFC